MNWFSDTGHVFPKVAFSSLNLIVEKKPSEFFYAQPHSCDVDN